MRKIWSGEVVKHESDFISWQGQKLSTAHSKTSFLWSAAASKVRFFSARPSWVTVGSASTGDPAEPQEHMSSLKKECDAIGRDLSEIEITCMWPGIGGRDFAELEAVGVTRVVMPMMGEGDPVERLHKVAEEVIA